MRSCALCFLAILSCWSNWLAASDPDIDPPVPERHSVDNLFGLSMGILPHVLLGAEPYSSSGMIPWTSSDVSDLNRTNTMSYGVRVGTFYAITSNFVLGLEVPYLARVHSDADAANPALHPLPPKQGFPNHNAVVSLDLHF
jgi:hypothetical protein